MPRAIWSGAISFGLVNVPVKLYAATSPKTVRFNQLNARTGARIKQKRVDASTGEEVAYEDIVKGYEIGPDRWVTIEPEELDALDPKATHTIDVEAFVDLAEIDPIYYDASYYLAPAPGGARPYHLLTEALAAEGKVAVGRVVLRSRQQLCALRPVGEVLTLTTMLWGDEVNAPDGLDGFDAAGEPASPKELEMARALIEMQSGPFDPGDYHDEYRQRVLALIEQKANGETVAPAPAPAPAAAVPDLMAALEASLAAVRDGADAVPGPGRPGTGRPRPAKPKPRAKKSTPAAPTPAVRAPARKRGS
ncbi:Ku protein [Conexibacter sp. DBS9H8]|uniref:non-homologous end joining protein Ku n=1 Tax=Conexibacter sp. DBS9H8 TaxID=2937801 RepID=UPI0020100790|nr:Ku protein [Conexibacter sp. DBS9H8]